jgi:hypothetical protein
MSDLVLAQLKRAVGKPSGLPKDVARFDQRMPRLRAVRKEVQR